MTDRGALVERAAAALMALGGLGHGLGGTLAAMPLGSVETLWSFSGAIAAWLLAALGWLGSSRPAERGLAAVTTAGAAAWLALMGWFMGLSGDWTDPRPLLFALAALGLISRSVPRLLRTRAGSRAGLPPDPGTRRIGRIGGGRS